MQDRFKFRIWDKPTSRMFYDVALGFIKAPMRSDWVCADTPDGQISYTGDRLKDIEIMQCTGLKDKNGLNRIFEGDIVTIATKYSGNLKGYVYYDLHTLQFKIDIKGYANRDLIYFVDKYGVIIIGNIYENPELLEEI